MEIFKIIVLKKIAGYFYSKPDKTPGHCVSTDSLRKWGLGIWTLRARKQIVSIYCPKFQHTYCDVVMYFLRGEKAWLFGSKAGFLCREKMSALCMMKKGYLSSLAPLLYGGQKRVDSWRLIGENGGSYLLDYPSNSLVPPEHTPVGVTTTLVWFPQPGSRC